MRDEATQARQRAVVVHAGARDAYQLAAGLEEAGLLGALVTDLYWPQDAGWARRLGGVLPVAAKSLLSQRSASGVPGRRVKLCAAAGLRTLLLDKLPRVGFAARRRATRDLDAALGRKAGMLARARGAALVSYSYCGYDALTTFGRPATLFQAHPHPSTMRRILREELAAHPDCAASLGQEWELALPEEDFDHLVRETTLATHFLVASSFTRSSLVEHGTSPEAIRVIPYGVDLQRFHPGPARLPGAPLRLLFVGRINQRKGVKYLLETLRLLDAPNVHLTVCGRVVDDLAIFRPFAAQVEIRPSVSGPELVAAYQAADLFVFPSVAEGFGQVLLEALACGLPILSTTHTAAPDLITDGVEGFVVEPRRPDLLAERLRWALTHRAEVAAMGVAARMAAERFTWDAFRSKAAGAVREFMVLQHGSSIV